MLKILFKKQIKSYREKTNQIAILMVNCFVRSFEETK